MSYEIWCSTIEKDGWIFDYYVILLIVGYYNVGCSYPICICSDRYLYILIKMVFFNVVH